GFENKISFSIGYYYKKTMDMLLRIPIAAYTGIQTPAFVNGGDVLNSGIESMFSYIGEVSDKFQFSLDANFTFNKNKVIDLNNQAEIFSASNYSRTVVGEPI